jgi:putative MATE family efflux protein
VKPLSPSDWNNKRLFSLLWPLIIEQILALTMGAADTIMVSFVGEYAVSGVNIIDNINNLLIIGLTALATGGAVVTSQFLGRRDPKNASLAARQLVYIITFISLLIMGLSLCFRKQIISLIYGKIENDVMDAASIYFLLTALSYPALALYNGCAALFRSMGNSRVPMLIALMVNIINVGGNAFLIFFLKIGVAGAAISTLISRSAAAIILVVLLLNSRNQINLSGIFKFSLKKPMIRNILNVGIPGALENSMFQIGRLLTQRIFTAFGTIAIAGNAIASVVNSFSFMPGNAFGIALLTIVGQCIGAGDHAAAKKLTAKMMRCAWLTVFIISGANLIFMETVLGFFNLSLEAHTFARLFLQIHCISMIVGWTPSFTLPNALRAAGDVKFVMLAASVSMWLVRVSLAYILVYVIKLGPAGVWLAMGCDFISRGTAYSIRWYGGKWIGKKIIG